MITLYGIANCDTVKKAMKWLDNGGFDYNFHDYKKAGITAKKLSSWSRQKGWENLLNKKSATWREVAEETKAQITNEKHAVQLMLDKTSIIKRPVIELDDKVVAIGFNEAEYATIFK